MTLEDTGTPSLKVSLSQASDIVLKPLDWEKSRNTFGKPRYDASACGRDYVVYQSEGGSWHLRVRDLPDCDPFRSAEEALTAAEDDYKAYVRGFLDKTVESLVIPDVVAFPAEPDEASIRALFTLNTANVRSSAEVRQVYAWLRNLAASQERDEESHLHIGTVARLYDADARMADGDSRMTAAEEVLAWILIEKLGVPDDVGYSPQQAQDIIVSRLAVRS